MDLAIEFVKRNGILEFSSHKSQALYVAFNKDVPDGAKVEAYFDVNLQDGSLGQLAKVHKHIREICFHTGHSFDEIKFDVKIKAGLYLERKSGGYLYRDVKSFGKCSKEELSLAIHAALELSVDAGMELV